jgi:outer membrane protein assembly factor BamA
MPIVKRFFLCLVVLFFAALPKLASSQASAVSDSMVVVGKITLYGNEKTKSHIVLRELAFKSGDTLSVNTLQLLRLRAMRQIFGLELFTSVDIEIEKKDSFGVSAIDIYLKERWYLFVIPIVEIADRNFNQWWVDGRKLSRLNYGVRFKLANVRGRNETMRINFQAGFTRKFSVDYLFPYINKKLTIGSALNFTYSDNREVWYATQNNKLLFFRDSAKNNKVLYSRIKAGASFIYRKKIYTTQALEFEFNDLKIADTVTKPEVSPNYFLNAATHQQSLYIDYKYTYDMRDFRFYTLNGRFLSVEAGNYFFLNSKANIFNAYLTAAYNKNIIGRHYFGLTVNGKYSSTGRQPYNLYKAFGYGYFVRGFEYYVVDGQHFGLGKIDYIYNLLKQRYIHIPTTGFKKFRNIPIALFAKVYYDAGYVYDKYQVPGNTYSNNYLAGFGAGFDIITYYDRVIKIEYSFTNKGQSGLFLHFNALF